VCVCAGENVRELALALTHCFLRGEEDSYTYVCGIGHESTYAWRAGSTPPIILGVIALSGPQNLRRQVRGQRGYAGIAGRIFRGIARGRCIVGK